jgi:TRAP-type C4-dicarboxylate transport system permease small subunit
VIIGLLLGIPILVAAADPYGLEATANAAKLNTGLASKKPAEIVGYIISVFLSLLGILFFILIVYGGYLWMTSYGNETKVTKAKELIINAAIGLVIIIAAYTISSFVITKLAG